MAVIYVWRLGGRPAGRRVASCGLAGTRTAFGWEARQHMRVISHGSRLVANLCDHRNGACPLLFNSRCRRIGLADA